MNALDRGINLLKANKFNAALEEFNNILTEKNLATEVYISAYQNSIKSLTILNQTKKTREMKWRLLEFLISIKNFDAALTLINLNTKAEEQEYKNKKGLKVFYEASLEVLISSGEVEKGKEKLKDYLDELLERKNYTIGLSLIEKYSNSLQHQADFLRYLVAFYTYQGNEAELSKKLKKLINLDSPHEVERTFNALQEFGTNIRNNKFLYEISIDGFLYTLKDNRKKIINTKKLISIAFEYILLYPEEYFIYRSLIKYGNLNKKKGLLSALKNIVELEKVKYRKSKKNLDFHRASFEKIIEMKDEEKVDLVKLDLAEELFSDENKSIEGTEAMERDHDFLLAIGDEEGAESIISEKFEEKRITKERLTNEVASENTSNKIDTSSYQTEIEKKIQSILKIEATGTVSSKSSKAYYSLVRNFVLEDGPGSADALITTFHTLEFFEEGVRFIEFLQKDILTSCSEKKAIDLNFQKAVFLYGGKKYHQAIDLLEASVDESPLVEDEELAHLYLLAECYDSLGRKENALKIYKLINNKLPNYRQASERIKVFEAF